MTRRTFWLLALGGVAFWSLLTWGAYALVTSTSDVLVANADLVGGGAELQFWLQWSLRLLEGFGVAIVWAIWAIGAITLVGSAAIGSKALAVARRMYRLR